MKTSTLIIAITIALFYAVFWPFVLHVYWPEEPELICIDEEDLTIIPCE